MEIKFFLSALLDGLTFLKKKIKIAIWIQISVWQFVACAVD